MSSSVVTRWEKLYQLTISETYGFKYFLTGRVGDRYSYGYGTGTGSGGRQNKTGIQVIPDEGSMQMGFDVDKDNVRMGFGLVKDDVRPGSGLDKADPRVVLDTDKDAGDQA
ncbi:hypothetical protein B0H14DRAFT_2644908 [Mycena olivaceomarginata]|nr:hypothetical protein B0H14DRAFT_2644908 [Mycena olivaceomarginata]